MKASLCLRENEWKNQTDEMTPFGRDFFFVWRKEQEQSNYAIPAKLLFFITVLALVIDT